MSVYLDLHTSFQKIRLPESLLKSFSKRINKQKVNRLSSVLKFLDQIPLRKASWGEGNSSLFKLRVPPFLRYSVRCIKILGAYSGLALFGLRCVHSLYASRIYIFERLSCDARILCTHKHRTLLSHAMSHKILKTR